MGKQNSGNKDINKSFVNNSKGYHFFLFPPFVSIS